MTMMGTKRHIIYIRERLAARFSCCHVLLACLAAAICSACSTAKLPEGEQLYVGLKKIKWENYAPSDNVVTTQEEVEAALALPPNGALFGSSYYRTPFAYGMWIWNLFSDGDDGFSKWMTKTLGKQPMLLSQVNADLRATVAQSTLKNHGYFSGNVSQTSVTQRNPKKAKIAYTVNFGPLTTVDTVAYTAFPPEVDSLIEASRDQAVVKRGTPFTVSNLASERTRVSNLLRNNGYYYFLPTYATWLADTINVPREPVGSLNDRHARLWLQLTDSLPPHVLHKYRIGDISIGIRKTFAERYTDSLSNRHVKVLFSGHKPKLRPRVLVKTMYLRPGNLYSLSDHSATVSALEALSLFNMVDLQFVPRRSLTSYTTDSLAPAATYTAPEDTIDLQLNCVLDRPYDVYVETNFANRTIGRMGPELKVGLTKRNAFRGAEKLDINLHGSLQWQSKRSAGDSRSSYEYGAEASLEFPRILFPFWRKLHRPKTRPNIRKLLDARYSTLLSAQTDIVYRPGYYKMHIVSGELTYRWQTKTTSKHEFSPLTLKYQYNNSHTATYDSLLIAHPYLLTTMGDYFIPQMRYTYVYTSPSSYRHPIRWEFTAAQAGNVTSLLMMASGKKWNEEDKKLFKNPYAQFVKMETDFTKTWSLGTYSSLVGHVNAGVIVSYGNSSQAPFSESFYVGGANSIRAFPVRTIGPGRFPRLDNRQLSYLLQNGDIKFVANLEYRTRLAGDLYGAAFIDVGNVWQISDIEEDDDEQDFSDVLDMTRFHLKSFLNQMAVGTGVGLRYDLGFLILRLDWGVGLHLPYETSHGGFFNVGKLKDAQTLHFAVGYPF